MGYDQIRYELKDAIATITLYRPEKLNALTDVMRAELVEALRRSAGDPEVRAIIVTGSGRAFCAGGDIAYMAGLMEKGDEAAFRELVAAGAEVVHAVRAAEKPVIAAVHGPAAGGGMNLALACDLRIASSEATFAQSFVKIGMHPDWGGTYLLPRLIGVARAMELALSGRPVAADEALRLGIVSEVVAPEALPEAARALALSLASSAPLAVAAIKRNFYASPELNLEAALDLEVETQLGLFRSRDAREGMAAFREKRAPRYQGE